MFHSNSDRERRGMSSFPSIEEFDRCVTANKKIAQAIHWRDLPVNVIYRVKSKEEIKGEGMLLELVNSDNEETMVWALPSVMISLCEPYPKKKIPYIRSLGAQRKRKVFQTVFLQDRQTSKKLVRNGVKKEAVARKIVRKGVKRSAKEAGSANKVRKVDESTLSSVSTPPGSKSASESSVLPP